MISNYNFVHRWFFNHHSYLIYYIFAWEFFSWTWFDLSFYWLERSSSRQLSCWKVWNIGCHELTDVVWSNLTTTLCPNLILCAYFAINFGGVLIHNLLIYNMFSVLMYIYSNFFPVDFYFKCFQQEITLQCIVLFICIRIPQNLIKMSSPLHSFITIFKVVYIHFI